MNICNVKCIVFHYMDVLKHVKCPIIHFYKLNFLYIVQDVFDLPFHMARDQIEQSLRAKMSTIKVRLFTSVHFTRARVKLFSALLNSNYL